ncbi:hypothetical protein HZS_1155, partial [Henneguya salminicola]
ELVKEWPLINNPILVVSILFIYLACVLLGPKFRKNKNPLELRKFMLYYNLVVVSLSAFTAYGAIKSVLSIPNLFNIHHKERIISNHGSGFKLVLFNYMYLISKIIEFTDTIIFILRKKFNQVSLFHVYHHASVFIVVWHQFKYYPGPFGNIYAYIVGMPLVILNSIVHVFMYSYYLLSGLGPSIQKYLWWKKYITQMQLVFSFLFKF